MMRICYKATVFLLISTVFSIWPAAGVRAWTEHPLLVYETLAAMPEIREAKAVRAEGLDAFLMAEEKNLASLLDGEEKWARQNLAWYKPLPENMKFRVTGDSDDVRERFCRAVRINPRSRIGLYLQYVPGAGPGGRPSIKASELTFLKNTSDWKSTLFVSLKEGERASPLDIVTTASDEPDFGLDIGLYEDNGTPFGKVYGFGKQPFGNPALEYSSQAPFHMGYYHESRIISTFAPFVKQTYPEERIHLYRTLSEFAFRTGHDYWGWRFMGIGLHYVMDLTQPYHASMLPGVSTLRMLCIDSLNIIGFDGPEKNAIQIVSNRHTAIEKFQQVLLQEAYRTDARNNPVLAALKPPKDCPAWDDRMPRDVISARSSRLGGETDRVIAETLPPKWVTDPSFEIGTSPELDGIMDRIRLAGGDQAVAAMTDLLRDLITPLPGYTCSYVRGILDRDASRGE